MRDLECAGRADRRVSAASKVSLWITRILGRVEVAAPALASCSVSSFSCLDEATAAELEPSPSNAVFEDLDGADCLSCVGE